MSLLRYVRSGGSDPGEDEWLDIDDSGAFTLERHVGRRRIGAFAGTLDADLLKEVNSLVAGLASPPREADERRPPDRPVSELLRTGPESARTTVHDDLPAGWDAVRDLARDLVDRLTDQPVSTLELTVNERATEAVLSVLGDDGLLVRRGDDAIEVAVFDADEEWVGSTRVAAAWPGSGEESVRLDPPWSITLPLEHGLDFTPDASLSAALRVEVFLPRAGWGGALVTDTAGAGWDRR